MPKFRLNVTVEQRGPLFDIAPSKAAASRATVKANDRLAEETKARIDARLRTVLVNPTGYYQSRIRVVRGTTYRGVDDSNAVYGGWLEGVSHRNRATRFKGYRTFRMVRQSVERDKADIVAPVISQLVRELGGK